MVKQKNMSHGFLTLIRHGQSEWNRKNLFTGWEDIKLSEKGKKEAKQAGLILKDKDIPIDFAFSSALTRAIHTLEIILKNIPLQIPITKAWQLNERHYGALQGQNKQQVKKKFGEEQVQLWRRSFDTPPPPLKKKQSLSFPELYKGLKSIPLSESLKDTSNRVLPFWEKKIWPLIKKQKSVLISAHGNSLRALIKNLEYISDENISTLEIKTGRPIIYMIDKDGLIFSKEFC